MNVARKIIGSSRLSAASHTLELYLCLGVPGIEGPDL